MLASAYITHLIHGECSQLAVADVGDMSLNPDTEPSDLQLANQAKFVSYLNLANLALHKRFHLLRKSFEMDQPADGEEYTLPADFLVPIDAYYSDDNDPVNIRDSSVNMVSNVDTAVSILLPEAFKAVIKGTDEDAREQIIMRYAAAPVQITRAAHDLKISQVYTEAVLNYTAYKAHAAVKSGMQDENNTHYLRYEASCKQIVTNGMWGNNEIERNTKLEDNGFV